MRSLLLCLIFFATSAGARSAHFHKMTTPLTAAPRRIISLAPVVTETLFALGRGDRVVAVTRYCDRPATAKALPKVGGFTDISLERVMAMKPDLVIAMPSMGQRRTLDRLRQLGVPVFVAFADTLAEIDDLILGIGRVTGASAAAQRLVAKQKSAISEIPKLSNSPRTIVLVATRPIVAAGPGTFAFEAIATIGAENVVDSESPSWPTWSLETLAAAKPEIIFLAEGDNPTFRALIKSRWPGPPPRVLAAQRALFMRPGPTLYRDIEIFASSLARSQR